MLGHKDSGPNSSELWTDADPQMMTFFSSTRCSVPKGPTQACQVPGPDQLCDTTQFREAEPWPRGGSGRVRLGKWLHVFGLSFLICAMGMLIGVPISWGRCEHSVSENTGGISNSRRPYRRVSCYGVRRFTGFFLRVCPSTCEHASLD